MCQGVFAPEANDTRSGWMALIPIEEMWMGSESRMPRTPELPSISQQEPMLIWSSETTYGGFLYSRPPTMGDPWSQRLSLVPCVNDVNSARTRAPSPKWVKFLAGLISWRPDLELVVWKRGEVPMAGTFASRLATQVTSTFNVVGISASRAVRWVMRESNVGGISASRALTRVVREFIMGLVLITESALPAIAGLQIISKGCDSGHWRWRKHASNGIVWRRTVVARRNWNVAVARDKRRPWVLRT